MQARLGAVAVVTCGCFTFVGACDPCDAVVGPAVVEIGTGFDAFEPLPATLQVQFGLQGGTHLNGALAISGLFYEPLDLLGTNADKLATTTFQSIDSAGEAVGGYEQIPVDFRDGDDGRGVRVPEPVVFFVPDGSVFAGQVLTLRASVEDICGNRAEASADVEVTGF